MKNLFLFLIIVLIVSCTKDGAPETPPGPPPPPVDTTLSRLLFEGEFMNGPYGTTVGKARIFEMDGKWTLRLQDFRVNNGPDLKVYLSREQQPLNFIRLGDLKAVSGEQVYDISGMPDIAQYKFALIHCEQFNHLFGSALLMKP